MPQAQNRKTNSVEYPEPVQSGFLFAALDDNGTPAYAFREATVTGACAFNVVSGTPQTEIVLEITCASAGAVIYYTLDGSQPTTASPQYMAPLLIQDSLTVLAFSKAPGLGKSDVVAQTVTMSKVVIAHQLNRGYSTPVYESSDGGATWAQWPTPSPTGVSYPQGAVLGAGVFILYDWSELIITRDRGVTWKCTGYIDTTQIYDAGGSSGSSRYYGGDIYGCYYAGGMFFVTQSVAPSPFQNQRDISMWYSYDGLEWNRAVISGPVLSNEQSSNSPPPKACSMAYRNGVWIYAVIGGVLRSTDGYTWLFIAYTCPVSSYRLHTLVATPWGFCGQMYNYTVYSVDAGLTWLSSPGAASNSIVAVLKNAGVTIAAKNSDGSQWESADGVVWNLGKAPLDNPNYLYASASSAKVDALMWGYYSNDSSGKLSSPLAVYRPEWTAAPLAALVTFTASGYNRAHDLVWTGSSFVTVSPSNGVVARSPDGMTWSFVTLPDAVQLPEYLLIDDGLPLPVNPFPSIPVPVPGSSVPSGSYPCTSAGVDGTYYFGIGTSGYFTLITIDGSDPNVNLNSIVTRYDNAGVNLGVGYSIIPIKAGQTVTIRARNVNILDLRVSAEATYTITATQV